jgi:excisionase family DNA binding protein
MYTYSMPKLYSDTEAADQLGISVATVRRMRVKGELGYLEIGRRVFVTEDQIKDLIRRGRRDVTASVRDAQAVEQLPVKTPSSSGARRSRLDRAFLGTSEDLRNAYENAEALDTKAAFLSETSGDGTTPTRATRR